MSEGSREPQEPGLCPRCSCRLKAGELQCPECGRTGRPLPKGLSGIVSAALLLWPVAAMIAAITSDQGGLIGLAGFLHLLNGPISLVIIRNSYVAPQSRTGNVVRDLHRASPATAAMAIILLGLTWLLPLLGLGACLVLLMTMSGGFH